jgi:uncharacterized Zn finger protein
MVAISVIQRVDAKRLQKGVEGLMGRAYEVRVTRHSEGEVRGFVRNGDGKEYGCTLTEATTFCSCKDALYRSTTCKHCVALALYVIRNPQGEPSEGERKPDLRLARVREGFCG